MSLSASDKAIRKGRITASEAGDLLGRSPYCKADEAIEKWVARQTEDPPTFAPMDRGHRYEPIIIDAYLEKVGDLHGAVCCQKCPTLVHPEYPWLAATFDRLLYLDGVPDRVIEAKFVGSEKARKNWADGVPDYVVTQIIVQLAVAHARYGVTRDDVIADLLGNTWLGDSRWTLWRNAELEREIVSDLERIYRESLLPRLEKP